VPLALVQTQKTPVGYLMREFRTGCVFDKSILTSSGETTRKSSLKRLELYLLDKEAQADFNLPPLSVASTVDLIRDLFRTVELFHEKRLVVGDISSTNLVVQKKVSAKASNNRLIFLDVDSFKYEGRISASPQARTLQWASPEELGEGLEFPSRQSDVYKCALVALRLTHNLASGGDASGATYSSEKALEFIEHNFNSRLGILVESALSHNPESRPNIQELSACSRRA